MEAHVWEEGAVRCSATLSGPKYEGASKIEFVFTNDAGAELGRVTATTQKEDKTIAASAEWKAKKPEGDALFYRAKYRVFVDGAPLADKPTEIAVWAKAVTITAKGEDGKVLEGASCRLTQPAAPTGWTSVGGATNQVRRTDDKGQIAFELPYPGELTGEWQRPYVLATEAWTKADGTKREAKLKIAFRAKLVFPMKGDDPSKPTRQYVNLAADGKHPERGSKLVVSVAAKAPAEAEVGDTVYLIAKFDAKNNARTPSTGGHAKGVTHKANAVLDSKKTATFDLELGHAGGDQVVISVGGTEAANDDTVTVETWRKIHYELMAPKAMQSSLESRTLGDQSTGYDLPAAMRSWFSQRLAKGFVQYECWSSQLFEESAAKAGTFYDASFIKATGSDRVWVMGGQLANDDPATFKSSATTTIHMRLCDKAVSPEAPATFATSVTKASTDVPVPGYLYKISLDDGSDSITEMTWEADVDPIATPTHPAVESGAPKKGAADRSWFVHKDHKKLEIKLGGDAAALVGAASATKCPIKISFKWATAGGINGNAGDGRQLMVMRRPPKAAASTICHELGHSMGQTVKLAGTFAKKPPHGLPYPELVPTGDVYDGKGHTGTHCAHGVSNKAAATYKAEKGDCIMFGSGNDDPEPSRANFCDTCIVYIKARNLTDVRERFKDRVEKDC